LTLITLPGYRSLVRSVIDLADELCEGRLAALGGGGYHIVRVVPLAWTWVLAKLQGVDIAEEIPEAWRERVRKLSDDHPPSNLGATDVLDSQPERDARVLKQTEQAIREVRDAVFPFHDLKP
jgi:acetoin utilization protein AcuC